MIDELIFKITRNRNWSRGPDEYQVIKRYLAAHPDQQLQTITYQSTTEYYVVAAIAYIGSGAALIECKANTIEDAVRILAVQIASLEIPVIAIAETIYWLEEHPAWNLLLESSGAPGTSKRWQAILNDRDEQSITTTKDYSLPHVLATLLTQIEGHEAMQDNETRSKGNDGD